MTAAALLLLLLPGRLQVAAGAAGIPPNKCVLRALTHAASAALYFLGRPGKAGFLLFAGFCPRVCKTNDRFL